jgi:hypothetical protein
MKSLHEFIYEALNEKSAVSMLADLYGTTTVDRILPDAVVEFLVENGNKVDSYKDMKNGGDYIVLTPNPWDDNPQMQSLSYWEKFKFQANMGNKKAPSWEFTLTTGNSPRKRGQFIWRKYTDALPSGCELEHLDKDGKKPFCIENYHIIEVTPKLKGFVKELLKL